VPRNATSSFFDRIKITTKSSFAMQQMIACSEDAFAFGEPDEVVFRNYDYLLTEDCLPLSRVRRGISDRKYGYRYKLLWDGIISFFPDGYRSWIESDYWANDFLVALVVISNAPLFVDIRRHVTVRDRGRELMPAGGGLHLQFYIPAAEPG
jgi:hypothetical protein